MSEQPTGILVEWNTRGGRQQVSRIGDAVGEGSEALKKAMDSIKEVAAHVRTTIDDLTAAEAAGQPGRRELKTVEVDFGLKLDAELGAFIAKAGVEANLIVKMTWERPDA